MIMDNRWYSSRIKKMFVRELEVMDEGRNPEEHLHDRFAHIHEVMSHTKFIHYVRLAIQEFYANYW